MERTFFWGSKIWFNFRVNCTCETHLPTFHLPYSDSQRSFVFRTKHLALDQSNRNPLLYLFELRAESWELRDAEQSMHACMHPCPYTNRRIISEICCTLADWESNSPETQHANKQTHTHMLGFEIYRVYSTCLYFILLEFNAHLTLFWAVIPKYNVNFN